MSRAAAIFGVALVVACSDPVREQRIEKLGPEAPGVKAGPLHRGGQPCTPCHGAEGGTEPLVFSIAGTIYQLKTGTTPLANAILHFIDSSGVRYQTGTNCAGNFYVQPGDYKPDYPMWVSIEFGGVKTRMNSPIFRDPDCATCHFDDAKGRGSQISAGHVYFAPENVSFPDTGCAKASVAGAPR